MKEGTETALYNQGYMDGFDDAEKDKDTPGYWDKLTHQAAISAMHGIMSNPVGFENIRCTTKHTDKKVAEMAIYFAEELVKGLKLISSQLI